MRLRIDNNKTHWGVGPAIGVVAPERNHLFRQHTSRSISFRRSFLFKHGEDAVVPNAAYIAAACIHDSV
ncbi:MAG: hypothetical protein R3C20_06835 [Planctomycetaceae bacterium]